MEYRKERALSRGRSLVLALLVLMPVVAYAQAAVTIAWDPSDTPSVWYNLYRSTSPMGPWVKVNEQRIGYFQVELEFTDTKPILGTSYYTVTAENQDGESDKSDAVPVSISQKPQPPKNPRKK